MVGYLKIDWSWSSKVLLVMIVVTSTSLLLYKVLLTSNYIFTSFYNIFTTVNSQLLYYFNCHSIIHLICLTMVDFSEGDSGPLLLISFLNMMLGLLKSHVVWVPWMSFMDSLLINFKKMGLVTNLVKMSDRLSLVLTFLMTSFPGNALSR